MQNSWHKDKCCMFSLVIRDACLLDHYIFRSDEQKYEVVNIDDINTESYDIILISDYNHGVVHSPQKLIANAKCPVIVDPKGLDWSKYSGAYCIKPNRSEFEEVCGELTLQNVSSITYY